jgi:hypothetical protein
MLAVALLPFGASSAAAKTVCESEAKPGSGKYKLCVEGQEMGFGANTKPVGFTARQKTGTVAKLTLPSGNGKVRPSNARASRPFPAAL